MKQGVWWVQSVSLRKYGLVYFVKYKNDMHALGLILSLRGLQVSLVSQEYCSRSGFQNSVAITSWSLKPGV